MGKMGYTDGNPSPNGNGREPQRVCKLGILASTIRSADPHFPSTQSPDDLSLDDNDTLNDLLAILGEKDQAPSNSNQGTLVQDSGPLNWDTLGCTPQLIQIQHWPIQCGQGGQNLVPGQGMTDGQLQNQFQGQTSQASGTFGRMDYDPGFPNEKSYLDEGSLNLNIYNSGQQQNQIPPLPIPTPTPQSSRGPRRLRQMPKMPPAVIEVNGIEIEREWWAKAMLAVLGQDGHVKAAKVLFSKLYTYEEIQTHTHSQRGDTKALDHQRNRAIEVAVSWMRNNKGNPYNFDPAYEGSLTPAELKEIQKKVYVQKRSDWSRTSTTTAPKKARK